MAGDTYVYDSLGRIQTATRSLDGLSVPFTYVPSYSQRDERLGLNIFYGQVITGPTPDPILYGQSAQYDALGQPTQLSLAAYGGGPTQQANFSYDLAGQTSKIQRTQGSTVAAESRLAYDNMGRLASLQHVQVNGSSSTRQLARYDQAYDAVNRIVRIDSSVDEASVYNYDKTGQLLSAQMTFENNEAYTYDANGNRTSGGTQSSGNHKNLVTQDAKYTYLYDGENNRTRRTEKATGNYQDYTWDHRNRLTRVDFKNSSGVTVRAIEYRYDSSDMKMAEYVDSTAPFDMANASANWFIYDGANVVLDFARADMSQAPGATISKRYFQGPGVDQLLAQENLAGNASQSVWWILPDHLGSTRDLVTASGSVIAHFQFDSFGNILDGRENVTRYQFTGREHDSNTDYNYHRARWYDPGTGKFLTEDPISFAANDPNITRMVGNNVLNATDPSGLWFISRTGKSRALAKPDAGDTVKSLADIIGLDPTEYRLWLRPIGESVMPRSVDEVVDIDPNCQFTIPNHIRVYYRKSGFLQTPAVTQLRNISISLTRIERAKGFKVTEIQESSERQFLAMLRDPDIIAFRTVSHGSKDGLSLEPAKDTAPSVAASNIKYKLAFVHAFACYSGDKQVISRPGGTTTTYAWWKFVGPTGYFFGKVGWYFLWSSLDALDNQGNPIAPGTQQPR